MDVLDKILSVLPSYKGYKSKSDRKDSDSLIRNYILRVIDETEDIFREYMSSSTSLSGDINYVVNMIIAMLDHLRNSLKHSEDSFIEFYDKEELSQEVINRIMEYDLKITEICNKVLSYARMYSLDKFPFIDLRNRLMMTLEAIRVLNDIWNKRLECIKGV